MKAYLTIFTLIAISIIIRGDVIPDNSHYVIREVRLTNVSEFPDMTFIGYASGPIPPDDPFYVIYDTTSLICGYKFNSLQVFGLTNSDLETLGGIEALTEDYVSEHVTANEFLASVGYYIDDESLLHGDYIEYNMVKTDDGDYVAKILSRELYFSDGETKVIDY